MHVLAAKALLLAQGAYKHRKKILIAVFAVIVVLFMLFTAAIGLPGENPGIEISNINEEVLAYYPVIESYASEYGIPEYVNVILAIIMVETGGKSLDIMQSSQSLGLPPNSITDPIQSIEAGIKYLATVVNDAREKGLDYWTPIQSYNYGIGFNNYVYNNGKQYTFELATDFSGFQSGYQKINYSNPVAASNGFWRYSYGNMYYVKLVQIFIGGGSDIGNVDASPLGAENYQILMNEALRFNGWPYQWGGVSPSTSFDCSGLTQYVYAKIGYNLPRTAAEQRMATIPIAMPQPGDLVFFKGTNSERPANAITHVGIYVDENRMFDASNSGIGYHNWSTGYWGKHFAGFGRVIK